MPAVRIFIDDQEVDPCAHMKTILEMLQLCENELSAQVLGRPGTPLRRRPSGSTPPPPRRSNGSASPGSASPTSVTIDDPDNPFQTIEVPVEGLGSISPPGFGSGPFSTFGNGVAVVDDPELGPVRMPLIPMDLKLAEALRGKHKDNPVSRLITGMSRAVALLMNAPEDTISGTLARSGNTTINATHLGLLMPVLKAFPGPITDGVAGFLKDVADIALLDGDIGDLQAQVDMLDRGIDIPFIGTSTKKETEVFDRIRGNLEILKFEQAEEF